MRLVKGKTSQIAILGGILSLCLAVLATGADSVPAKGTVPASSISTPWFEREDLWRRIKDQREVLVSAVREGNQSHLKGAGMVTTTPAEIGNFVKDPAKVLAAAPDLIKDFKWDVEKGQWEAVLEFLWLSRKLSGTARFENSNSSPAPEQAVASLSSGNTVQPVTIRFALEKGLWLKMEGVFKAENRGSQTLAHINVLTEPNKALSWPERVAMESVLHRAALGFREAVEKIPPMIPPRSSK